jgi:hypothetical protein
MVWTILKIVNFYLFLKFCFILMRSTPDSTARVM